MIARALKRVLFEEPNTPTSGLSRTGCLMISPSAPIFFARAIKARSALDSSPGIPKKVYEAISL